MYRIGNWYGLSSALVGATGVILRRGGAPDALRLCAAATALMELTGVGLPAGWGRVEGLKVR